jgi:hypothetical protein
MIFWGYWLWGSFLSGFKTGGELANDAQFFVFVRITNEHGSKTFCQGPS